MLCHLGLGKSAYSSSTDKYQIVIPSRSFFTILDKKKGTTSRQLQRRRRRDDRSSAAGASRRGNASVEVRGGAAERVVLPLEHGRQVNHGGGMVRLAGTEEKSEKQKTGGSVGKLGAGNLVIVRSESLAFESFPSCTKQVKSGWKRENTIRTRYFALDSNESI